MLQAATTCTPQDNSTMRTQPTRHQGCMHQTRGTAQQGANIHAVPCRRHIDASIAVKRKAVHSQLAFNGVLVMAAATSKNKHTSTQLLAAANRSPAGRTHLNPGWRRHALSSSRCSNHEKQHFSNLWGQNCLHSSWQPDLWAAGAAWQFL